MSRTNSSAGKWLTGITLAIGISGLFPVFCDECYSSAMSSFCFLVM